MGASIRFVVGRGVVDKYVDELHMDQPDESGSEEDPQDSDSD